MGHAAANSRARSSLSRIATILGGIAVTETLEHRDVVAAVAVDRDLVLDNTVVACQPGNALALVARSIRDLEHHRVERRVDHAVRALGQIRLKVAFQLERGHAAVDLAHVVTQDVSDRLVKILLLVIAAAGTHAAHYDALDGAVLLKARLMHLKRTARKHAVGRGTIKANAWKCLEQLLGNLRIDGPGLKHLAMAVANDGSVGAAGIERQTCKAMLADRQRRATRRGNHVQPGLGQLANGAADGSVGLVQGVKQRSV